MYGQSVEGLSQNDHKINPLFISLVFFLWGCVCVYVFFFCYFSFFCHPLLVFAWCQFKFMEPYANTEHQCVYNASKYVLKVYNIQYFRMPAHISGNRCCDLELFISVSLIFGSCSLYLPPPSFFCIGNYFYPSILFSRSAQKVLFPYISIQLAVSA